MKILIASDIHGNLEYTKKLEELINLESVDKIILLGDILYNYYSSDGEDINEVINILNKYASITIGVVGNCDTTWDIKRLLFPMKNEIEEINIDNKKYYLTHGHKLDKYSYLLNGNNYFYGHTHIYDLDGPGFNPGSVGNPKFNKPHTCLIYNNKELLLINLEDFTIIRQINL